MKYQQIPVNAPAAPGHSYSTDGAMRIRNVSDPVYAPNSKGGPQADSEHFKPPSWYVDGEIMRSAYVSHAEDDDWGQAGTAVREVLDDAARDRLVSNRYGPPAGRRDRAGARACLPVLEERRQEPGQQDRAGVRAGQS